VDGDGLYYDSGMTSRGNLSNTVLFTVGDDPRRIYIPGYSPIVQHGSVVTTGPDFV